MTTEQRKTSEFNSFTVRVPLTGSYWNFMGLGEVQVIAVTSSPTRNLVHLQDKLGNTASHELSQFFALFNPSFTYDK